MYFPISFASGARCLSTPPITPDSGSSTSVDQYITCGPYGKSSVSSSASSSTCSIFSYTGSEISCASSIDLETTTKSVSPGQTWPQSLPIEALCSDDLTLKTSPISVSKPCAQVQQEIKCSQPLPVHELRNPRRTNRSNHALGHGVRANKPFPIRPPTLLRETERKGNFVDCLVDTSAQMIEAFWPITTTDKCGLKSPYNSVLPLRTFIQETLRRSRTSFSTLQVALYYLVLIRPFVPVTRQPADSMDKTWNKTLTCGRRTFLAALILASKYLQDRNYSTRAWSKISGLPSFEINTNEMAFLAVIDWKLHMSETIFDKWTKLILKHTPSTTTTSQFRDPSSRQYTDWQKLVLQLTPCLGSLEFNEMAHGKDVCARMSSRSSSSPSEEFCVLSPYGVENNPFALTEVTSYTIRHAQPEISHRYIPAPAVCLDKLQARTAMSSMVRHLQSRSAIDTICSTTQNLDTTRPLTNTFNGTRRSSMSICSNIDSDSSDLSESSESTEAFELSDSSDTSEYTQYCTSADQSPSSVASEYLSDSSNSSCHSPADARLEGSDESSIDSSSLQKASAVGLICANNIGPHELKRIATKQREHVTRDRSDYLNDLTPNFKSNNRKRSFSHVIKSHIDRPQSCPYETLKKSEGFSVHPLRGYCPQNAEQDMVVALRTSPAMKKLRCGNEDYSPFESTPIAVMSQ